MTACQAQLAQELLAEGLHWIGLTDLTDEEEEKATQLQCRIERLLEDVGGAPVPPPVTLEEYHTDLLAARDYHARCLEEKDAARLRMNAALSDVRSETTCQKMRILRFQVAYRCWEAAERMMHNAEGAYTRALYEAER